MSAIKLLAIGLGVAVTIVVVYQAVPHSGKTFPTFPGPAQSCAVQPEVEKETTVMTTGSGRQFSRAGYDVTPLDPARIEALAKDLTPEQRDILLAKGTERAFCGAFYKNKEDGIYTCRLCGLPLFKSDSKFESGTGWPSFFQPVDEGHIHQEWDKSLHMLRQEILCARCRSHLGHVFDDGPPPTGLRYCLNSAALKFHKAAEPLPPESLPVKIERAYFAGGCFWGIEDRFQKVPGVIDAVSGYMGGDMPSPDYKSVCGGQTGHAESVRVTFDPSQVSYRDLLVWFFQFHDPTQFNRQGPDIGSQYRSAIFTVGDEQMKQAKAYVEELSQTDRFRSKKIVTQLQPAQPFHEAEAYHQDYHARHGGSCPLP